MNRPANGRTLRINRLDLSLRGMSAADAERLSAALGPALARALGELRGAPAPAETVDGGRVRPGLTDSPVATATVIADRVAGALTRGRP